MNVACPGRGGKAPEADLRADTPRGNRPCTSNTLAKFFEVGARIVRALTNLAMQRRIATERRTSVLELDGVLDRFLVQFEADLLMVGALVPMLEPVPGFIQMLLGNDFLGDIEPAGEDRLELSKRSPITDGLSRILLSRACECDRRQIRLVIRPGPVVVQKTRL